MHRNTFAIFTNKRIKTHLLVWVYVFMLDTVYLVIQNLSYILVKKKKSTWEIIIEYISIHSQYYYFRTLLK